MKSKVSYFSTVLAALLIAGWVSTGAQAQDDVEAAMKKDQSGTNPINFTHDIRFYNEYMWLDTPGESSQNVQTLEYRQPIGTGKWQFRTRMRVTGVEQDLNNDGVDEFDEWGLGEADFRFLTVPYFNKAKAEALAFGFETFLPTAEKGLGSERLSFGPQVFYAKFNPLGLKGYMFAPGYQHKFSVAEESGVDTLHQGLIDLYVLWISQDKQYWWLLDPQLIIDYEEDKFSSIIDLEMGMMMDKINGAKGHSVYVRPSIGLGGHRATDASIEFGYKIIW